MATEIERKFLVVDDGWRREAGAGVSYRQGYLAGTERCSVRVRIGAGEAWLNVKGATLGVSRPEFEYPVPVADAQAMLDGLCEGTPVEKVRYVVRHADHAWEVDEFTGANAGLVVAEIELAREDEPFESPPWVGEEVSHDARYYNACLAERPFSTW